MISTISGHITICPKINLYNYEPFLSIKSRSLRTPSSEKLNTQLPISSIPFFVHIYLLIHWSVFPGPELGIGDTKLNHTRCVEKI